MKICKKFTILDSTTNKWEIRIFSISIRVGEIIIGNLKYDTVEHEIIFIVVVAVYFLARYCYVDCGIGTIAGHWALLR